MKKAWSVERATHIAKLCSTKIDDFFFSFVAVIMVEVIRRGLFSVSHILRVDV